MPAISTRSCGSGTVEMYRHGAAGGLTATSAGQGHAAVRQRALETGV